MGLIHNTSELFVSPVESNEPFIIGVYQGKSKPKNVDEFLHDFVKEARSLEDSCIVHNNDCSHTFKILALICDMPARSFIKCVKGHNAYSGCDRCTQYGVYDRKVTFPKCDAPLRTDDACNRMVDNEHHLQQSPLVVLNLGMVSNFPLDYIHLVCLGVVRKLVSLWLAGPLKTRLGPLSRAELNEKLLSFTQNMPYEFARKPRAIVEFERWKATEYRSFLLYTGPVCLLHILPAQLYDNFMLLSVAITVVLSPSLCQEYADYSRALLILFVKHFGELYGQDKLTYNVHGLIHLCDDVKLYDVLDKVSAFPFENFLGKVKKSIRQPRLPLQQVVRRLSEVKDMQAEEGCLQVKHNITRGIIIPKQTHSEGPIVNDIDIQQQYKQVDMANFRVKLSEGDRHVQLKNGDIVAVHNIVTDSNNNIWLIYKKFHDFSSFFSYPLPSTDFGIFKFGRLGQNLHHSLVNEVQQKYIVLTYKSWHVGIPLLHSS